MDKTRYILRTLCLSLFIILLFGTTLWGQEADWTKTYGGSSADKGLSVQQTSDGGFIIAGYTTSFGAGYEDVYLIKTDANGDTLWTKTYGGSNYDYGYSVQQTSDGGFIIAGSSYSFGAGSFDVYLIKTDDKGDTLWTKTYGGSGFDYGYSVQQTSDGGFIIAGSSYSFGAGGYDVYLIKTDANGDTLWTKTYGGSSHDVGYSVQQTSDGGFIITGYTHSFGAGNSDIYLIKTDANGDTMWTKTYGGSDYDDGYSVQQTSDGGFIITGYTSSFGAGSYDVYLIKTNSNGDTLWTKTYGGSYDDIGYSVQQTSDGGFIITGYTHSFGAGSFDVYLIKTDDKGDTLWTKTYGGSDYDDGYSVQQTSDGGFIITGYTESFGAGNYDVYLIRERELIIKVPNGIEVWAGGNTYIVRFKDFSPYNVDHLRLVLSTDGGATYPYLIADNIPITDTMYLWTTPNLNSSECRVKVQAISEMGDVLKEDKSDANFTIDATNPTQVHLLEPDSSIYVKNSTVNFYWSKSTDNLSGVSYYEFQRAYDSLFTEGVFTTTATDTQLTLSLSDTIYYWRVRAVDSAGNISSWSSVYWFELDTHAPNTPSLLLPSNNSWINTNSVVFNWTDVSKNFKSPVRYIIIIDTSSYFTNPIIVDTTEFSRDTIGLTDGAYYWKVKPYDLAGNNGEWSLVHFFTVDATSPTPPSLITPSNATITNISSVYFVWHGSMDDASGISHYILSYDKVNSFLSPQNIRVEDTSYMLIFADTTYYWRVRAVDSAGNESDWSSVWQLEVDAHTPNTPSLMGPSNNSWSNSNSIIFNWTDVSKYFKSPVRYVIMIDTSSYFTDPIIVDTTEFAYDTITLPDGEYYWRVKAYDLAGNVSNWSYVWYLGIDTQIPNTPTLTSPDNNAWYPYTYAIFRWTKVNKKSPVKYILQVDSVGDFSNPFILDTFDQNNTSYTLSDGYYYWRVRAFDEAGNQGLWTSSWQFGIDCIAPFIDSTTVLSDTNNYFGPFDIMTKVTDAGMLFNPVLHYRIGSSSSWEEDTMNALSNNWYKGTIPELTPQEITVEYYITAKDHAGNTSKDPEAGSYTFNLTNVNESKNIPTTYTLNVIPESRGALLIKYGLPEKSDVTISIYDSEGRALKIIRRGSIKPGYHEIRLSQNTLNRGVYFVRMSAKNHVLVKKFIITH